MKIKLSKSQWEQIGKTAGWITEAKKKKKWNPNPWAVCHTTVDKDKDPEKFERCVKDVKKKQKIAENVRITPAIKKTRTIVEEYEVCPHCNEEIMEKSIFAETVGDTWLMYHSKCKDKGPIQKITKEDGERALKQTGWGKTAQKTAKDYTNVEIGDVVETPYGIGFVIDVRHEPTKPWVRVELRKNESEWISPDEWEFA